MKYRVGRKQNRVILDENSLSVALFHKGYEDLAQKTCYFLNTDKRFSVSLVYTKQDKDILNIILKTFITNSENEDEALGSAIKYFQEEMKEYSLNNMLVSNVFESNKSA